MQQHHAVIHQRVLELGRVNRGRQIAFGSYGTFGKLQEILKDCKAHAASNSRARARSSRAFTALTSVVETDVFSVNSALFISASCRSLKSEESGPGCLATVVNTASNTAGFILPP